ncbi:MAG: glucosidase, partial [Myxococcales bacterium]|nr:glucosidase [Myxococcales bacterium]
NFTWWVNRTDEDDDNLFAGGFLGLDNIGVFDRSKAVPGLLDQADGTAWMAFFCGTMLSIALELAGHDPAYEDVASKFLEHYVAIADAMNCLGGRGLWSEEDGFYYDQLHLVTREGHSRLPMRLRSMVGLIPIVACEVLEESIIERMPGFKKRMLWFLKHRGDLARHATYLAEDQSHRHLLLAIPSKERLLRVLRYLLDEREFLSPHGIRALSRHHAAEPFVLELPGERHEVRYAPAESDSYMFGGNSNWRGPVWFPVNYLIVEALERYHHFYGDALTVEYPTGSGEQHTLHEVSRDLARRLTQLFLPDAEGRRPCHGDDVIYGSDPAFRDLVLFYEYFDGDTGRGCGASHQTGWTALVAQCFEKAVAKRPREPFDG